MYVTHRPAFLLQLKLQQARVTRPDKKKKQTNQLCYVRTYAHSFGFHPRTIQLQVVRSTRVTTLLLVYVLKRSIRPQQQYKINHPPDVRGVGAGVGVGVATGSNLEHKITTAVSHRVKLRTLVSWQSVPRDKTNLEIAKT